MANPANDVQQCIKLCQDTSSQLRTLANTETNPQVKTMLTEGAHHLDLCIVECQYSLQQLQAGGM